MEYRYFITEDKKKEWKKEKFGDEYEKLLLNFLNCNVDIKQAQGKATLLQDDFWLTKHTGNLFVQHLFGKEKSSMKTCVFMFIELLIDMIGILQR